MRGRVRQARAFRSGTEHGRCLPRAQGGCAGRRRSDFAITAAGCPTQGASGGGCAGRRRFRRRLRHGGWVPGLKVLQGAGAPARRPSPAPSASAAAGCPRVKLLQVAHASAQRRSRAPSASSDGWVPPDHSSSALRRSSGSLRRDGRRRVYRQRMATAKHGWRTPVRQGRCENRTPQVTAVRRE